MKRLTPQDQLKLQQLRLRDWLDSRDESHPAQDEGHEPGESKEPEAAPNRWVLTGGVALHPWQVDAVERWFKSGRRGTVKVVTGAGKTILALAIAERLQAEDPELRVAVVVPTIVLMNQWYDEFRSRSNLPSNWIGRLGGGHEDDFQDGFRILITVLASAHRLLPAMVRRTGVGEHLLLIADECHRAGAPEMSRVLETPRAYSLGLSATPEREDAEADSTLEYSATKLGLALGDIVCEMTVSDAVALGVLPPFRLEHYGLSLNAQEAIRYERLSRSLNELREALTQESKTARQLGSGEALLAWCRRVAAGGKGELASIAKRYVNDTTARKLLLYRAEARRHATVSLLREAFEEQPDARAILFHESLVEVERLFDVLYGEGFQAVMEHSELPAGLREASLDLFRRGSANVIVSARTLIEGFNVPEVDLGIIVASSSSTRQRIQSIGRVLRKHRRPSGEDKLARVCVLYVRDSVDELIYEKEDWNRLLGAERNVYYLWNPPEPPRETGVPPRSYVPTDAEVDLGRLRLGDVYPGRYEGEEYSCDTMGNVRDQSGRIALNPQDVPARVIQVKGSAGRFRVTPRRQLVLVLARDTDTWQARYAGQLEEPFCFETPSAAEAAHPTVEGALVALDRLQPGDDYHGPLEPAQELVFKRKRGGVVTKQVRQGELYATGAAAEQLLAVLKRLANESRPVHRFFVNELGHAFWREGGRARFLAALERPLEFPSAES